MSADDSPNGPRQRRSSITQAALSNLFQRPTNSANGSQMSGQGNGAFDPQRRRLSVSTVGLGTSPTGPATFNMRRGSVSTNSDSIDESAIEDDELPGGARTAPNTPFTRRMSFGAPAMRAGYRPGGGSSPGNGNSPNSPPSSLRRASQAQGSAIGAALSAAGRRASTAMPSAVNPQASNNVPSRAPSDNATPRADQQGFNWSEQLRSRAESSVSGGSRPSFSLASSPPRAGAHDRARSVSDMLQPPVQAPPAQPQPQPKPAPRKPDAFQERILKGDFYMD